MTLQLKNNLCLHNPKIQTTKTNLHIKNIAHTVIEQTIHHSISACFRKQRHDEDKRDAYARSKSPQKSFVQYFRSPFNDRTKHYDSRYQSRSTSRDNSYNKTIHKIDTVLHLEIDLVMTKVLLLHTTLDHDMIRTNVIPGLTVLHTDPPTDLLIDTTLALDADHAPIPEITNLQNIQFTFKTLNTFKTKRL